MADYTNVMDYDLQQDYVDKMTDEEKLKAFREMGDEMKQLADLDWKSEENYSEEFMVKWFTDRFVELVEIPFYNSADGGFEPSDDDELITPPTGRCLRSTMLTTSTWSPPSS